MDYGLAGRTFVVTGAARGQGAAEAELLVGEGARVVGADILDDVGKALAERLTATGPGTIVWIALEFVFSRSDVNRIASILRPIFRRAVPT